MTRCVCHMVPSHKTSTGLWHIDRQSARDALPESVLVEASLMDST